MSFLRIPLNALMLTTIVLLTQAYSSENYIKQMNTIILFYETLAKKGPPNVSDFFMLFSEHNEAELELILRQKFPSLDFKGNWFDDQQAKSYVDKVYNNPKLYPSLFLQCIKSVEPKLFADKVKRQIEFPPKISKDFRAFGVITHSKKVVFEFSQNETTIENIYLPDDKSIYILIERCINERETK